MTETVDVFCASCDGKGKIIRIRPDAVNQLNKITMYRIEAQDERGADYQFSYYGEPMPVAEIAKMISGVMPAGHSITAVRSVTTSQTIISTVLEFHPREMTCPVCLGKGRTYMRQY